MKKNGLTIFSHYFRILHCTEYVVTNAFTSCIDQKNALIIPYSQQNFSKFDRPIFDFLKVAGQIQPSNSTTGSNNSDYLKKYLVRDNNRQDYFPIKIWYIY